MGKSIFDKIQAKLELFRLEQRYTRRRNRRSTFVSNAIYVDGEYVYQTPSSTGNSTDSSTSTSSSAAQPVHRIDALHGEKVGSLASVRDLHLSPAQQLERAARQSGQPREEMSMADRKRLNRYSSMPGFGRSYETKELPRIEERRTSMIG